MVLKTNTSIGSRNAETRDQLIDAAIICLAEVGYAGATMRRIADTAGVTQGPRQYYFPTPVRMFEAVVDRIHSSEGEFVEEMRINFSNATIEEKIRAVVEPAFRKCGNPPHLAMIELKLACRGNQALREALEGKINEYEARNDHYWIELLEETGLSETELKNIRTTFAAALRGLGVAIAAGSDPKERLVIGETVVQMSLAHIDAARTS